MLTRKQLKKLARHRLREAEVLFNARLYDGAAYLCGYVVELALKARIYRHLGLPEYPATGELKNVFATHDSQRLLLLAGLKGRITAAENPDVFAKWSLVSEWTPERRYEPPGSYSRNDALDMLDAVRSRPNGVLTWLMKRW